LINSEVCALISSEKASPFMLFAYKPTLFASTSNAAELYQPGDAVFPSEGGFSKKTPIVEAPAPNALVILEANPKPVDAPITRTFLGPSETGLDFAYSICVKTFC